MASIVFVDIPELDEHLRPGFRVGPAVECRERARLDLGDMIAGLHRTSVIDEHQRGLRRRRQPIEKLAQRDVGGNSLVDRGHVRYSFSSIIQGLLKYG